MKDLLPYFERELVMLRRQGREFAAHYPKLAAQLHLSGDTCADPHVERLIQSSALLAARIAKRLDDDYPKFTEGLLEMLFPHYLRPFPACSIVRFTYKDARRVNTGLPPVSKGTVLLSAPVHGTACTFTTSTTIPALRVRLVGARFVPMITPPTGIFPPQGASSAISIGLKYLDATIARSAPLRIFIDGEPSFSATLRDCLFMRTVGAYAEMEDGRWIALPDIPVTDVGFDEDEALIPFGARSHPAYRLLLEYFAFPEKFNCFALDLAALSKMLPTDCAHVTLHLMLAGTHHDGRIARILNNLSDDNLLLGCTPVVNLFRQHGEPITVTQQQVDYPVRAHAVTPANFDIYSVESVLHRAQDNGAQSREVRPFYSLHHGDTPANGGLYWTARRDDDLAAISPGHEVSINLLDRNFDAATTGLATLSLELNCTNRDLPSQLRHGHREGDLRQAEGSDEVVAHLLRRPSPTCRFPQGAGAHWRLISHLTLNHHALTTEGLPAFREMLALNDVRQSVISQRQIAGIVGLEQRAATTWLRHPRGASLAHGMAILLTLDEEAFAGTGIHVFVTVLSEFLTLYVQANSFVELIALSLQSGEELIRCKPKNGNDNPV